MKASKTKTQALYFHEEEALEERKNMKTEGKKENRFDSCLLPKDNTNSRGNPTEQPLPRARQGKAQGGSTVLFNV